MNDVLRDALIIGAVIVGVIAAAGTEMWFIKWTMSDRIYSGAEAAATCGAGGKRVGDYRYESGRSNFTCVDAQ